MISRQNCSGDGQIPVSNGNESKRHNFSGYTAVNVGLDDPNNEGMRIMAISDLNNDKWTDIVTVNEKADKVTVWYFDGDTLTFSKASSFSIPNDYKVDSIIVMKS